MVRPALEGPLSRDMTMTAEVSLRLGLLRRRLWDPGLVTLWFLGSTKQDRVLTGA